MKHAPALWLVLLQVACQGNPPATNGAGTACSPSDCKLSMSVRWAVAVDPPASSGLLPTQLASQLVGAGVVLTVDGRAEVDVTLSPPAGADPIPPQADVLLSFPSSIPGLPDRSFQSPVASLPDGSVVAPVVVPSSAMGATALVTLQPVSPGDQTLPSYRWSALLSGSIPLSLPGDDVLIHGQLLSASNQPLKGFVARAFQNGLQVSDAPSVQANGDFEIRIPSVVTMNPVTLSLVPGARPSTDPWFLSTPLMATPGENLGTINLPAYQAANFFDISAVDPSTGMPMDGVTLVAQTSLGNALVSGGSGGAATYQTSAVTANGGTAQLSLLPGTAQTPIQYFVLATPPLGSMRGIQCVGVSAKAGATQAGGASNLATIMLQARPILFGTVLASDGSPVANLTVTATGTPDPPSTSGGCVTPATVSVATTTDARGTFSLPLDPGTYLLDYDPPPGLMVPRQTMSVAVSADPAPQQITLPQGTWLVGTVQGLDSKQRPFKVASSAVRFYEICGDPTSCPGGLATGPILVAAGITDANGQFQVAVPVPASP